jgi:hypothetical protein
MSGLSGSYKRREAQRFQPRILATFARVSTEVDICRSQVNAEVVKSAARTQPASILDSTWTPNGGLGMVRGLYVFEEFGRAAEI